MTTKRRDGMDSPFGDWLRCHSELDSVIQRMSCHDSDYWVHRYRSHTDRVGERAIDHIMLVEVKTHMRDMPFAQRDTLKMVDFLLRKACTRKSDGRRVYVSMPDGPGRQRKIRCFGVHLLQMSSDRPDKSRALLWNQWHISEPILVEILRFERDPDNPTKLMEERRHHTTAKAKILQLPLTRQIKSDKESHG